MDMEMLHKLRKLLCKQVGEYAELSQISGKALDDVADLIKSIKNIDLIMDREDGQKGMSKTGRFMGSYDDMSGRRGRDSMGRYVSRDGDHDEERRHARHQLRDMMEQSQDPEVQRALGQAMQMIDRM